MRLHVDLASHVRGEPEIIQAEKTPDVYSGAAGQAVPINGKFVIPMPPGIEIPVNTQSYILDVDGGDVSSLGFARMLLLYPQFQHIYFNPLLTADHVDELDPDKTFKDTTTDPPTYFPSRCQTGRPGADPDSGQMPTHTAILAKNVTTTPDRPGVLITDEIDLESFVPEGSDGFREFLVYWRLLGFETTHDIANSDHNEAAVRYLREVDQQPEGFEVWLTPDDGDHWCEVDPMNPVWLTAPTKTIRLAFINKSLNKIYLTHFATLF